VNVAFKRAGQFTGPFFVTSGFEMHTGQTFFGEDFVAGALSREHPELSPKTSGNNILTFKLLNTRLTRSFRGNGLTDAKRGRML